MSSSTILEMAQTLSREGSPFLPYILLVFLLYIASKLVDSWASERGWRKRALKDVELLDALCSDGDVKYVDESAIEALKQHLNSTLIAGVNAKHWVRDFVNTFPVTFSSLIATPLFLLDRLLSADIDSYFDFKVFIFAALLICILCFVIDIIIFKLGFYLLGFLSRRFHAIKTSICAACLLAKRSLSYRRSKRVIKSLEGEIDGLSGSLSEVQISPELRQVVRNRLVNLKLRIDESVNNIEDDLNREVPHSGRFSLWCSRIGREFFIKTINRYCELIVSYEDLISKLDLEVQRE